MNRKALLKGQRIKDKVVGPQLIKSNGVRYTLETIEDIW